MSDTLVVYFSRKGYARKVAEERAAREGADILRLETSERTGGVLGFWWCGRFGMHRWEMPLKTYETDVSTYERVIVVSPIWVFSACSPVYAFARNESGRVKRVSFVFVHFSPFMRYRGTAERLGRMLGATSDGYESVMCMWGLIPYRRSYATLSNS